MLHPRQLIKAFGARPTRALGQHFLTDAAVLEAILDAVGLKAGDRALEVGPGPGVLTCAALARGAHLVAIEKDRRAVSFLQDELPGLAPEAAQRLTVIEGDALRVDLDEALASLGDGPLVALGNLPYNVGTAIMLRLLESGRFEQGALMFQREVAERLLAGPGTKKYGSLTLAVQSRVAVEHVLDVPPGAFAPPPKVDSAVIRFRTPARPPVPDEERAVFEQVCRAAFSARRKTIRNALKGGLAGATAEQLDAILAEAAINPGDRPEQVELGRFLALARAWSAARG